MNPIGFLLPLRLLVVLSASMGGALPVGSLAVAAPQEEYFVGDIVTFKIPGSGELLTHRINSVKVSPLRQGFGGQAGCQCVTAEATDGVRVYETRGDANNVVDDWELVDEEILGKIVFHLPYIGYLLRLPQILLTAVLQTLSV